MAGITMYGIKNCDTVKKARVWLESHDIAYVFHDYKSSGVERQQLERWCTLHGWDTVLNRAGTTFKKLSDADKANLTGKKAIALMLAQPSMIKRPIVQIGAQSHVGFAPDRYQQIFKAR
jgi:arsenate reductase